MKKRDRADTSSLFFFFPKKNSVSRVLRLRLRIRKEERQGMGPGEGPSSHFSEVTHLLWGTSPWRRFIVLYVSTLPPSLSGLSESSASLLSVSLSLSHSLSLCLSGGARRILICNLYTNPFSPQFFPNLRSWRRRFGSEWIGIRKQKCTIFPEKSVLHQRVCSLLLVSPAHSSSFFSHRNKSIYTSY